MPQRRPRPLLLLVLVAVAILAASCGGGDEDSGDDTDTTTADGATGGDDASGGDGGDGGDGGEGSSDGGTGGDGTNTVGDDEDAADIVGNPDLDLEELEEVAPDAAEALDDIDDIVSIGDCSSETVGLAMSYVPEGYQCRVLDNPIGDLDGFTLFMPGTPGLEITVGTPSPLGPPCEVLQLCGDAQPIDLGSNTTMSVVEFGVPLIFGTHNSVDAEIVVTTPAALTPEQTELVTDVLEGLVTV